MEHAQRPDSLPLFAPQRKETGNAHFVTWTIDAVARMLRTRFEARRHVATMSAQWLREHEAEHGKRG